MSDLKYKITVDANASPIARFKAQFSGLVGSLKAGLSIDIGRRLIDGLLSIKRAFVESVREGIRFNAMVQTATIGIAAVYRQFDPTKFDDFKSAMREAGRAMEYLKQRAKETPATLQSLIQAYQSLSGPMSAANMTMKQQIDLTVLLSQALGGLGIREEQLTQESRALVTGRINENAAAAKILGITAEQIKQAREQGQLYEFLTSRVSVFGEAAKEGTEGFDQSLSNLKDPLQQAFGAATQQMFATMTQAIKKVQVALESPAAQSRIKQLASVLGDATRALVALGETAVRYAPALLAIGGARIVVGAGSMIGGAVGGAANFLSKRFAPSAASASQAAVTAAQTAATTKNAGALSAETTALAANTVAQKANAASRAAATTQALGASMVRKLTGRPDAITAQSMATELGASMVSKIKGPDVSDIARTTATYTSAQVAGFKTVGSALTGTAAKAAAVSLGTTIAAAIGTAIVSYGIGRMIGNYIGKKILESTEAQDSANAESSALFQLRSRMGTVTDESSRQALYSDAASKFNELVMRPGKELQAASLGQMLDKLQRMTPETMAANARKAEDEKKSAAKKRGDEWGAENSQARQRYYANQFARDEQTSFAAALSDAGDDPARQERLMQTRVFLLEKRKADLEATDTRGMAPDAYGELIQRASATADELSDLKQRLADFRREIDRTAKAEAAAAAEAEKEKKAASALDQQAKAQTAADAKEAYRRSQLTDAERVGELEKRNATIAKQGSAASATDQTEYWNNRLEVDRLKDRMAAAMNAEKSGDVGEAQASGSRPRLTGRAAWRAANNAAQVGRRADGMRMWGAGDRFGDQDPAMRRLGGGNLYGMSGWRHSPVRESPLRMRGRDPAETTAEKATKMEKHLFEIKSALEPVRK
jgi:hypothetical protein